jgi:thiol-disulfide isomerase/thioredoxin
MRSKKAVHNDIEMLYGKITVEQLYFDYPEWKRLEEQYQPDEDIVEQLKQAGSDCKIVVFFATWCGDSRREVPRFIKIIDDAALKKRLNIEYWAVDRKKELENGLPQKNRIEYVPTFIFFEKGKEVGRIVESPKRSLEQDMLDILRKCNH